MIPGSENDVFNRFERTNMKRMAPTTGIMGVISAARYGQSKAKKSPDVPITRNKVT